MLIYGYNHLFPRKPIGDQTHPSIRKMIGSLFNRFFPRWADFYAVQVTPRTHSIPVKRKCNSFDEIIITGCTGSYQNDNFQFSHGPLTRYVKSRVAHAPGMPGTFPPAAHFKENRQLAIPACITARAWRTCRDACRDRLPAVAGKTFPAFPAHAHPHFYVSGKRPIDENVIKMTTFSFSVFHYAYRSVDSDINIGFIVRILYFSAIRH